MTYYTCISIGINRYYHFQPLSYAIADAQGLVDCLEEHDRLEREELLLMTDNSPRRENYPTYPTRENIFNWLASAYSPAPATPLNASSILWFFFSGYGLHYQGEDYLIPIDGDPTDLINTAIPVSSVFALLQQQGAGKIVVILDVNRTPGMLGSMGVGEHTAQLAGKMGIACILASHPHQYSHEAASLGHGMFSAAFLEALKYYRRDLTLEILDHYLNQRLPELSDHHWRPIQNPIMVIPSLEAAQNPILPALVSSGVPWAEVIALPPQPTPNYYLNGTVEPALTEVAVGANGTNGTTALYGETTATSGLEPSTNGTNGSNGTNGHHSPIVIEKLESASSPNGKKAPKIPRVKIEVSENTIPDPPPPPFLNQNLLVKIIGIIFAVILGLFGLNQVINQWNVPSPSVSDGNNGNNQPIPTPEVPEPGDNNPDVESVGKEYLTDARAPFQSYQASTFSRAIAQAQKVPEDDPYYAQAQASIHRWSQNIWDIAQSRASEGNFTGAMAAARLIKPEQEQLHLEAQNALKDWEQKASQQQNNNQLLQKAKTSINSRQASSYIKAMQMLEKIAPGEIGYQEAQKLRQEWSRQVYLIANSRASRGNFKLAIQTALLVPTDSNSYGDAQKAIARWQQGKK